MRIRGHHVHVVAHEHDRSGCAAGEERQLAFLAYALHRVVEVLDLVQRQDLSLVGEEDVDGLRDELAELLSMTLDAEPVREREGNLVASVVRDGHRLADRSLAVLRIPQVPLAVRDASVADARGVDVVAGERAGDAERRVHRAMRIGRHHDQRPTGRFAVRGGRYVEVDPSGPDVVHEHIAHLVVPDLADERRLAPERGDGDCGVGRRAPRRLDRGAHGRVQLVGPLGLDERHRVLLEIVADQERIRSVADDVDDRVAQRQHVVGRHGATI